MTRPNISLVRKQVLARCLGVILLGCLAILAIPQYQRSKWPSIRVVRADGTPLKSLFEGVAPTEVAINMRDAARADARLAKRASRPRWLNDFLDIFDENVAYAQGSCDKSTHNRYSPDTQVFCTLCNGTDRYQLPCLTSSV